MEKNSSFDIILTENPAMKEIIRIARSVAPSDVNVLLTGESGTGKNVLSEAIHSESNRRLGPFVPVNCLAIPNTLIESELFGHEKGAFTDAFEQKKGSFESARGGTLYLDEIGDMTHEAQGKILEAIEDKRFRRVGGEKFIQVDARVIGATNQDLAKKIEEGRFREDLYYRLKEILLHVPPLRERKEDIPLFIRHFIEYYGALHGRPDLCISDAALTQLVRYDWPGNVRELKNVVQSAVLLCGEKTLWLEHFPFEIQLKTEFQAELPQGLSVEGVLKRHISSALRYCGWNKKKAAASLGVSRPRLDRYIKKFNLQK